MSFESYYDSLFDSTQIQGCVVREQYNSSNELFHRRKWFEPGTFKANDNSVLASLSLTFTTKLTGSKDMARTGKG